MSFSQLFLRLAVPLLILNVTNTVAAQSGKPKPFELTPSDLKKLSRTDLDLVTTKLPRTQLYIYHLESDSVGIVRTSTRKINMQTIMVKKKFAYDEIARLHITNPKRKRKMGLVGGAIGAAVGVGVGFLVTKEKPQSDNLLPLGQKTSSGFFEPIVGGVLGFGVGMILGETFSSVKLSPRERGFKKRMRELNPHAR